MRCTGWARGRDEGKAVAAAPPAGSSPVHLECKMLKDATRRPYLGHYDKHGPCCDKEESSSQAQPSFAFRAARFTAQGQSAQHHTSRVQSLESAVPCRPFELFPFNLAATFAGSRRSMGTGSWAAHMVGLMRL